MLLKKLIGYNENIILINNEDLIFHKIINRFKIHFRSFNDSK
jgi:hypothetical protein